MSALDKTIEEFGEAFAFDGFDPVRFRKTLKKAGFTRTEIVQCITIAVVAGPNLQKAASKAVDPEGAQTKAQALSNKNIMTRKMNGSSITLPRICASMPIAVLKVRKHLMEKGLLRQCGFKTTTDIQLQDPCFTAIARHFQGVTDYLYGFGEVVNEARKNKKAAGTYKATKEEVRAEVDTYIELASLGFLTDPHVDSDGKVMVLKDLTLDKVLENYGF